MLSTMSGARITLALILIMIIQLQLSCSVTLTAHADCCDNVKCRKQECGENRTLIRANPDVCDCCDRCALQLNESCILSYDTCEDHLACQQADDTGHNAKCLPVSEYPEGEDDFESESEPEVEMCDVENCERILRCPPNSSLVLDQPTSTAVSTYANSLECCKHRFAPTCMCNHQCPTVANVASIRHCFLNPNISVDQSEETCCSLLQRCISVAGLPRRPSLAVSVSVSVPVSVTVTVTATPPVSEPHQVCSPWLNRSRLADSVDKNDWILEQCTPSRTLTSCHGWYEATLRANYDLTPTPTCCADWKCASQRKIVCEAARCPQELDFVSVLLTNLEACVCVKANSNGKVNICPQRLCAARSGKCYHHTHVLDNGGCPICVSNEVPCNHSEDTAPLRRVCDDYRTGRHNVGERWFSESCGNCHCTQDGFTQCDVDCSQNNREWVSVNITLVLACTALAISLLVLIYIVGRKLRSKNWHARKQYFSRNQLINESIHGSLSGGMRNEQCSWRALNGQIPPTSLSSYTMERSRILGESSVWQPATDLSSDDFTYVALNGNTESFQKANGNNHTATTKLESNASNVNGTSIV